MNSLTRFLSLPLSERITIGRISVLLPFVRLSLRLLGFNATCRLFNVASDFPSDKPALTDAEQVRLGERVAALIQAVARRQSRSAHDLCLPKAITAAVLLKRLGVKGTLRLGARTGDAGFKAHAWIEVAGTPIRERPDLMSGFAAFSEHSVPDV